MENVPWKLTRWRLVSPLVSIDVSDARILTRRQYRLVLINRLCDRRFIRSNAVPGAQTLPSRSIVIAFDALNNETNEGTFVSSDHFHVRGLNVLFLPFAFLCPVFLFLTNIFHGLLVASGALSLMKRHWRKIARPLTSDGFDRKLRQKQLVNEPSWNFGNWRCSFTLGCFF